MFTLLQSLFSLQILNTLLRPLVRLIVGVIAVPMFRLLLHRVPRLEILDHELEKDLEQWFKGSLLLLLASANMESVLFGWATQRLDDEWGWLFLGLRVLLAIGVIESMPDQELFAIIHPGPARLLFPRDDFWGAVRKQWWPFLRGLLCRHLDRSSAALAILAAIYPGPVGWVCYGLAILQYLIIGLVSSRDKALDVLAQLDAVFDERKRELRRQLLNAGGIGTDAAPTSPGTT